MRPLELRLSGFRSYRTERVVSFRDMDIVAIIGDTGAGKSSLLEAMTWALYGASTWSRKTSSDLLAHNARRMTVTLEFEAAGERWLVTRSFARSGGGTAELRCESDPAGHAKIDGIRLVDPEIERLIGLPYDVFCSCVLLPQGKFERLLKATKGDKTDTLKSILRLEQLGELRERADGLARRVADREIKVLEARGRFLPDPVGDAAAAGERLAALRPTLDGLVKAQEHVRGLAEAARGHADQARAADDEAVRLAARRGNASVELARLAAAGVALEHERTGAIDARDHAAAERAAAETAHAAAVAAGLDVPSLTSAAGTLRAALSTRAREQELAHRIAADEQRHAELATLTGTARATLATAEAALTNHDEHRAADAASSSALSDRARALAVHGERVLAAVVTRDAAEAAVAPGRAAAAAATGALEAARIELEAATAAVGAATTHREAVQRTNAAAHLAAACTPGDPCPICARDLPTDFTAPEATDLAAATTDLNAATEALTHAQRTERAAALGAERAGADLAAAEKQLREAESALTATLTAAVAVTPDDVSSAAERAAVEAAAASDSLAELDAARPRLDAARREAERVASQRDSDLAALVRGLDERRRDRERAAAELGEQLGALPAFIDRDALDAAPLDERLEAARRLEARREAAGRRAGEAEKAVQDLDLRLQREVATPTAGLREQVLALARELPGDAPEGESVELAKAVEARVDARVVELRAAAQAAREAEQHDAATSRQVLAEAGFESANALAARLDEVRAETLSAQRAHQTATAQVEPVQRLDELRASAERMKQGFEALKDALADRAFVGFVVARRQKALLAHASRVLEEITGRYAFTDDFLILDRESGLPRSPDTLSGGETFIASLALALGLVEVADRSGGDLRALFLDEGFGTLDATILDTALGALEERAKAGRLIGLISHVPTVAERIDTVLEVHATLEGSDVRVLNRDERAERVMDALTEAV